MKDFMSNIEKTRNTGKQLNYYKALNNFLQKNKQSQIAKMKEFPVYATRQDITRFIEKYELFKILKNVPGSIVECGVAGGFGLMAFAHFCSIFEPYHYVRKIIGFDTFAGFAGLTDKDKTSKARHMKDGGLKFDSYKILQQSVKLYDMNRAVGHLEKVQLIKGDISKTFPKYINSNPSLVIALLYLDVDLYKPTLDTIRLAIERIPKGGIIAFDELNHPDYPGETIAAMESLGINNLKLRRMDISSMMSYAVIE